MNNAIARLKQQIETARGLLAEDEARLAAAPHEATLRLTTGSFRRHVEDLEHQLYLAKAERAHEVIHQRLIGPHLNNGAIPLPLLAGMADFFNATLTALAYRFRNGREMHAAPEELVRLLDLRLANVAMGSTRLTIVGNTAPDLAGTSLLEMGLTHIFDLLNDDRSDFTERVAAGGMKAARKLDHMLKEMEHERIGMEMYWLDPTEQSHEWNATPTDIVKIRARLADLTEIPAITETLTGEVELLAKTGRIALRIEDGRKVAIRYPRNLFNQVQSLQLGARATLTVLLNRVENRATQQIAEQRTLLAVA